MGAEKNNKNAFKDQMRIIEKYNLTKHLLETNLSIFSLNINDPSIAPFLKNTIITFVLCCVSKNVSKKRCLV